MRTRWPLWVLLASSLVFLASLYLPWEEERARQDLEAGGSGVLGLLNLFSGGGAGRFPDGWGNFGQPAGLLALGLAAGATASIAWPRVQDRLPIGVGATTLGVFALLSTWQIRDLALLIGGYDRVAVDVAYGSYLGLASAAVACISAAAIRGDQLRRLRSAPAFAAGALTAGILAAFVVPEITFRASPSEGLAVYLIAFGGFAPIFIIGLACLGLPLWTAPTRARARLAVSLGILVLVAGYLRPIDVRQWPWEFWLLSGCSLGLVALASQSTRRWRVGRPSMADAWIAGASISLLVALFLPWSKPCSQRTCPAISGWEGRGSATAGVLVVLFLVFVVGLRKRLIELELGAAIYVMAGGFALTSYEGRLEYGALVGFAAAALVVLVAGSSLRTPISLIRLLPLVACAAFVAIPLLAYSNRLPLALALESPWRLFLLQLAAVIAACRLFARWLNRPRDRPEIVQLPVAMLALAGLNMIFDRTEGLNWGGIATVGLCLLLAALGWLERYGRGLESLSEVFRVDRIPDPDG